MNEKSGVAWKSQVLHEMPHNKHSGVLQLPRTSSILP